MRFNPYRADGGAYTHLSALHEHLVAGPLGADIRALVEVRASQINGCAFCLAMHADEARAAGVPQRKLDTVAGWREDPTFTATERAALGLTEAMTRVGDGNRVDDGTWAAARDAFDDAELASLLYTIGLIQVWNRLNVAVEMPPRD